jgi:hypothetical protein
MQHVKMLAELEDVARRAADRWYVTTGTTAVGPVNLDLLARGVEAGKVPLEAFVRHEGWTVWRPLSELTIVQHDDEPGFGGSLRDLPSDASDPGRTSAPVDLSSPAGLLDQAADRREAFVLLMTAAVVRSGADAVIVHEIDDDCAVAVCAHGPSRREALGLRTPRFDPAVVAAEAGRIVVASPRAGAASSYDDGTSLVEASIFARLSRIAGPVDGALLLPIRTRTRVAGMIEIGRRAPFREAEVASLTALVQALAQKLEAC